MTDKTELNVIHQTLLTELSDLPWRSLLETLNVTGVADSQQLQRATGLSRDKFNRLADQLQAIHPDLCPMIGRTISRPGVRGHPPKILRLGEVGAAVLRLGGQSNVRACGLKDDTPIAHAVAMLDLYQTATQAGVAIQIDRELRFGNGRTIRPDGLITLPDGTLVILEIEQQAAPDYLRRMKDSLQNRLDFFRSAEGQSVQPVIRVLINLPRGKAWTQTLRYWQQVIRGVLGRDLKSLAYRILALPLMEFLHQPDWSATPDTNRWADLTLPSETTGATTTAGAPAVVVAPRLPDGLRRWSSHDDRLILEALWQVFEETAHQRPDRLPRADPEFFELMRLIYAASHDSALTPLDQASLPHASLYLLKRYLQMHPTLRADVQSALKRGASMIRWNPTMVLHRMQVAFDAFLAYHGWQAEGPLQVRATMTNWEDREPRVFSVEVWLDSGELLMTERNGVVPGRDEIDRAAKALAWVLYALVAHASRLGLDTPAFW